MTNDDNKIFQLEVVLPETPMPPRTVSSIDVPATDGRLTVMVNHQPVIVALQPGSMKIIDKNKKIETWIIGAGALQVENNVATVLVRECTKKE